MSKADCTLSIDKLKEQVLYCADTGVFTWNVNKNRVSIGDVVGFVTSKGYLATKIHGKCYFLHRLAWFYVYGQWPKNQIDHINGEKKDNRIENLRDVSGAQNCQNQTGPRKTNKTQLQGVSVDKNKKYHAQLMINRRVFRLGSFDSPEQAHEVYLAKKAELSTFFNPTRI